MRKLLMTTVAASLIAATPAVAATCGDDYAKWKQESLKDGALLSTIHTGKRAAIFRQKSAEMREAIAKGDMATCSKLLTWFATEQKKLKPMKQQAAFASGEQFTAVQASRFGKTTDKKMFVDMALYDRKGMYIGTVDDVIFVGDKPRYVVVSRGNVMGAEDAEYYVPVSVLYTTRNSNLFAIDTVRDKFYGAYPKVAYKDRMMMRKKLTSDTKFQKELDDRYKGISTFGQ